MKGKPDFLGISIMTYFYFYHVNNSLVILFRPYLWYKSRLDVLSKRSQALSLLRGSILCKKIKTLTFKSFIFDI